MFLINVHELDVVFAYPIVRRALEDKIDDIWSIFGLQSEDVCCLCGFQNLCEGGKVDSESNVAVASVWAEGFRFQHHGNEGNMGVIHGLEGNARVIAVEVTILDEVLDSVDDLGGVSSGSWNAEILLPS